MSPQIITPEDGDIIRDAPSHTVYTRDLWGDVWTEQVDLYCDWCYFGSGNESNSAQLYWRYGEGMNPERVTFGTYSRKTDLLNKYVQVSIDQGEGNDPIRWHGIIAENGVTRAGAYSRQAEGQPAPARVPAGHQGFIAYGFEWHLQRTYMHTSYVADKDDIGNPYEIKRALTFNDPNAYADNGNRTWMTSAGGVYVFSEDLSNPSSDTRNYLWSSRNIVDYLIRWHMPRSITNVEIPWELTARAKTCIPDWDTPQLETDGRSLFELLCQLFDRSRLLGWCVRSSDANNLFGVWPNHLELDVFSFNDQPLQLPSGGVQEANPTTVSLDFDRAVDVLHAVVKEAAIHNVEQVVIRGAKKRSIFSISYLDSTLEADWTAADQAAYQAGPNVVAVPDVSDKQRRLLDYRGSDRFDRVFSYFRLPADWDYEVGDGTGGAKHRVCDLGVSLYRPTFTFERYLPRKLLTAGSGTPVGSSKVQIEPLALLQLEADGSGVDRYQHIEKLAVEWGIEDTADGAGRTWSASVKMRRDVPGVAVNVTGSKACQHFIAYTDFTQLLAYDFPAQLDWKDNLILTVMAEWDGRVEAKYPSDAVLKGQPVSDVTRKLYFQVEKGDRARLDWVCPNTVLGIADGELLHAAAAGYYLEDDTPWMEDVAKLVYQWYGTTRQAFSLVYRQVNKLVSRGDLITKIGAAETEEEVNSVVTALKFDLLAGTTEITTSFAELDALRF